MFQFHCITPQPTKKTKEKYIRPSTAQTETVRDGHRMEEKHGLLLNC